MSDLTISDQLTKRIQEIAQKSRLSPEELLTILIERYEPSPRPASSLTDEDIEAPPDIQDKEGYRQAVRTVRPKLYRIARRYWAKIGDSERLRLTDEELDKQFWLIDHEGIPRLKSEQGTIELPPDPLEDLIGVIDTDATDLSTTVRESVAEHHRKKYGIPD